MTRRPHIPRDAQMKYLFTVVGIDVTRSSNEALETDESPGLDFDGNLKIARCPFKCISIVYVGFIPAVFQSIGFHLFFRLDYIQPIIPHDLHHARRWRRNLRGRLRRGCRVRWRLHRWWGRWRCGACWGLQIVTNNAGGWPGLTSLKIGSHEFFSSTLHTRSSENSLCVGHSWSRGCRWCWHLPLKHYAQLSQDVWWILNNTFIGQPCHIMFLPSALR